MINISVTQERVRIWKQQYPEEFEILKERTHEDAVFYSNACERIIDDRNEAIGYLHSEPDPSDKTCLKIWGYSKARDFILSKAYENTRLTPELLFDANRILIEAFKDCHADYRSSKEPHKGKGIMSVVRHIADPNDIEALTKEFCTSVEASIEEEMQPLLLIPEAILDFQYISPLAHGNGRMCRLLTEFLLIRTGFDMICYQSLDHHLYENLRDYVAAMYKTSSQRKILPRESVAFTENLQGCLDKVSNDFNTMFPPPKSERSSKSERIRYVAMNQNDEFTKNDIMPFLPGVSPTLIQQGLSDMVSEGLLSRTGRTKGSRYGKTIHR